MYITYLEYTNITGPAMPQPVFSKYEYEAERVIDKLTSGIDNIRKLEIAYPENEKDKRAVMYCMAALISELAEIDQIKKEIREEKANSGENGMIASKSSGSESISYVTDEKLIEDTIKATLSIEAKEQMMEDIVFHYLRGVQDANGVNMLYGGEYPCTLTQ